MAVGVSFTHVAHACLLVPDDELGAGTPLTTWPHRLKLRSEWGGVSRISRRGMGNGRLSNTEEGCVHKGRQGRSLLCLFLQCWGIKPSTLHVLGKHWATQPPQGSGVDVTWSKLKLKCRGGRLPEITGHVSLHVGAPNVLKIAEWAKVVT